VDLVRRWGATNLDEMVVRIGGRHTYLWRAFDSRGEVWTCWFSTAARRETPIQRRGVIFIFP
jgi:transposase-like protein